MQMWASARAFTRDDIRKAFDAYAAAHGRELATLALERSTGAREVYAVPAARILNAMAELICGYSFAGQSVPNRSHTIARCMAETHECLARIRETAFARRRS